jgi:hypothetical protein
MLKLNTIWTERKDVSDKRLDICKQCEFYDSESTKCKKCGCFMRYKSMLPYSKCPLDKW